MQASAPAADERVADVQFDEDRLIVDLMDGRTIAVPLAWYPRLFDATHEQRLNWRVAGAGYGIHWPAAGFWGQGILRDSGGSGVGVLGTGGFWGQYTN